MSARQYDPATIDKRFGMFLALLDAGEDMSGTTYRPEEGDVTDSLEGLTPELAEALTNKARAETRIAVAKAQECELQIKNVKASNDANRVLVISGPILDTEEYGAVLMRWSRRDPKKPITVYLNTPGGSIFDGNALGHTIDQLRAKGHKITIYGSGTVLSMGAVLLQYADERVLAKDSVFMVHSMSGGLSGSIESVVDATKMWEEVNDRLLTKLTERANISKQALKNKVKRKELFLTAEEALKMGFCDRVE